MENKEKSPTSIKDIGLLWQGQKDTPALQAASSATVAMQQYPPQTSRLKTIHRIVFLTPLTLLGFKSLKLYYRNKKEVP